MSELIKIVNHEIAIKVYQGQRVVTFKDIDTVHERPEGTARRNFNTNKKRLVEGKHYFVAKQADCLKHETRTLEIPNRGLTLITEMGYLMLVKSFTDDLAWEVQEKLVDSYFTKNERLTQEQMMRIQLGMVDDMAEKIDSIETRLEKVENTKTIDYGQQRTLARLVNHVVIEYLGGKDSPAYKTIGKKIFAECNGDIRNLFEVNSRNNIPRIRFEEAKAYIRRWKPNVVTQDLIRVLNAHNITITNIS